MVNVLDKMPGFRILWLIIATLLITSFIIHMPTSVQKVLFGRIIVYEPLYTDIVNSYYNQFFNESCSRYELRRNWFNESILMDYCRGRDIYPYPYIHYRFNHPPLTSLLFAFTTYIEYLVTPRTPGYHVFRTVEGLTIFYIVYSLMASILTIIGYRYLVKTFKVIGLNEPLIYLSSILLSTIVIYTIYDFSYLYFTLITLFLYYYINGDYKYTYLYAGLSASLNPHGFIIVFLLLYSLFVRNNGDTRRIHYLAYGLSPYLLISLLAFTPLYTGLPIIDGLRNIYLGCLNSITYSFMESYCNNCLYLLLINDPFNQVIRALMVVTWFLVLMIYLALEPRVNDPFHRYAYIVIYIAFSTLFTLQLTPQILLVILPLLPPLYIGFHGLKPVVTHYIVDSLNSLIIIYWFKDIELRRQLSFLGLPLKHEPYKLESPIQWIAQIRNIVLLTMIILSTMIYMDLGKKINTSS